MQGLFLQKPKLMQIPAVSPITLPYRLFGTSQSMHSLSIAGDVTLLMC